MALVNPDFAEELKAFGVDTDPGVLQLRNLRGHLSLDL